MSRFKIRILKWSAQFALICVRTRVMPIAKFGVWQFKKIALYIIPKDGVYGIRHNEERNTVELTKLLWEEKK